MFSLSLSPSENPIRDVQHAAQSEATLWEWRSFSFWGHAASRGLSAEGSVQSQSPGEQWHVQCQRQGSSQHRQWHRNQPRPETQLSSGCQEVTQEPHTKLFVLERKWGHSLFLLSVLGGVVAQILTESDSEIMTWSKMSRCRCWVMMWR